MLWHMSDCFLWQPNRLHTKRWRPRPINRFVAHGGQKSDWAWNWIQSHRSSWLWWLWRCRAEFLLPGSSWSKKYSCAPGWSVMDLTRGSLYDLFIIFIIPVCLLHSVTFCYILLHSVTVIVLDPDRIGFVPGGHPSIAGQRRNRHPLWTFVGADACAQSLASPLWIENIENMWIYWGNAFEPYWAIFWLVLKRFLISSYLILRPAEL